jgi:hypothetical protein
MLLRMLVMAMALSAPSATPPPDLAVTVDRPSIEMATLQSVKYDLMVVRANVPEVTVRVVRAPVTQSTVVSRLLTATAVNVVPSWRYLRLPSTSYDRNTPTLATRHRGSNTMLTSAFRQRPRHERTPLLT